MRLTDEAVSAIRKLNSAEELVRVREITGRVGLEFNIAMATERSKRVRAAATAQIIATLALRITGEIMVSKLAREAMDDEELESRTSGIANLFVDAARAEIADQLTGHVKFLRDLVAFLDQTKRT